MKLNKYHLNYATIKRRGFDDSTYEYIYTVHKFPVKAAGFDDVDFMKGLVMNAEINNNVSDDFVRFEASVARSRSKVLQLGCNNKWDYFVTLTFDKDKIDRYDLKTICKSLLKFFDNYKQRKCKNFKYLVIPEQHKDGAYHFHGFFAGIAPSDLVVNIHGYLDFVPYCKKYGFCSLSEIKDRVSCANYVCKYISKDMFDNTVPEPRTHLYYASRGLKYDELLHVGTAVQLPTSDDCVVIQSAYCQRFIFNKNIFDDCIVPFENLVKAPELPNNSDLIVKFKKRLAYIYCISNHITLNDKTDLLKKYNDFKDDIIQDFGTQYDKLRAYLHTLKHPYTAYKLSDAEIKELNEMFEVAALNDVIIDNIDVDDISFKPMPFEEIWLQAVADCPEFYFSGVPAEFLSLSDLLCEKGVNNYEIE